MNGVRADWEALYEREYPRLLRALLAIAGDEGAAEDAVQEAFVRAYKQGIETLERPGAWLLVVATRVLFRDRRRRVVDVAVETLPAARDEIDFAIERADLLAALRQLPERQRAVVVARYYYDLSYAEIANAFAIRSGTVGATLSQALGKLRAAQAARQLVRGALRP
ncbi:MAG TPA: sigma-70 family RNA polymerase sigma factor [Candidatus Limnocylindria bacterium]|nr:sigma-70 family RNA polymerase sigma factor [Candidatus Limnocylindria bacterium]